MLAAAGVAGVAATAAAWLDCPFGGLIILGTQECDHSQALRCRITEKLASVFTVALAPVADPSPSRIVTVDTQASVQLAIKRAPPWQLLCIHYKRSRTAAHPEAPAYPAGVLDADQHTCS